MLRMWFFRYTIALASIIGSSRVDAEKWVGYHFLMQARAMAKATGLTRYYTGKPCRYGHTTERLVRNGACVECSKIHQSKCYAKDPSRRKRYRKAWEERNREFVAAKKRDQRKAHYRRNKATYRAAATARKLHIKRATPVWADLSAIKEVYIVAARLTEQTGILHDVDHIIPLRGKLVWGLHIAENLQPMVASENRSKSNRFSI